MRTVAGMLGGYTKVSVDGDTAAMQATMGEVGKRMQRFVGMAKLKKMALNVLAYELTASDIGNLKGVFEAMDAASHVTEERR